MKKLTPVQKKFVEKLNEVLKRKHIKLVMHSKFNLHASDPICFEVHRPHKKVDVCAGWPSLDTVVFNNDGWFENMFDISHQSDADTYVDLSIRELGLMYLEDCSSYEELLLKLELIS